MSRGGGDGVNVAGDAFRRRRIEGPEVTLPMVSSLPAKVAGAADGPAPAATPLAAREQAVRDALRDLSADQRLVERFAALPPLLQAHLVAAGERWAPLPTEHHVALGTLLGRLHEVVGEHLPTERQGASDG